MRGGEYMEKQAVLGREHSLKLALKAASDAHRHCILGEVPGAAVGVAEELVELLEAWAEETGVR